MGKITSMSNFINLRGQRFGFWMVIEQGEKNSKSQTQWLCECECGIRKLVTSNSLRTGNSTSCGCNHAPNLEGKVFGDLTVLKLDTSSKNNSGRRQWLCECKCSNIITTNTYQLRNDLIKSCDQCLINKEKLTKADKKKNKSLIQKGMIVGVMAAITTALTAAKLAASNATVAANAAHQAAVAATLLCDKIAVLLNHIS